MERAITKKHNLVSRIANTELWAIGLEGILENKLTKNMRGEKTAEATKWFVRIATTGSLALSAWACDKTFSPVDLDTATPQETEVNSEEFESRGTLTEVVDKSTKDKIINSLPENIPSARNGIEKADIYQIEAGKSVTRFVMYELTDEEIENGLAVEFNGKTLVQSIALYSEKIDEQGNITWERLIAVSSPSVKDSTQNDIFWVYDKNGFPTKGYQSVSLDRPVLSYPIPNNTNRVLYSPLIPNDGSIKGWDGFNPFYVDINGSIPGSFKVSANYSPVGEYIPEPATSIPDYTFTPTFTVTPEITPTPMTINENDLEAVSSIQFSERVILENNNGPLVSGKLDTDVSLTTSNPPIHEISMSKDAAAKAMFMVVYEVFASQHPDVTIEQYAKMVKEVQDGVEGRNPLDIGVLMYANDLNDGIPYQTSEGNVNNLAQTQYLVIPWYDGTVPEESNGVKVKAIREISFVAVRTSKVDNITTVLKDFDEGMGINIDKNNNLIFSLGLDYFSYNRATPSCLAKAIATLPWYINKFHGNNISYPGGTRPENNTIMNLLLNANIKFL